MNILMVLSTKKYPPDRRVEREAHALAAAGHNVYLIARRGPGQMKVEIVEGVHVIRTPLPFQKIKPIADTIYFYAQRYWIYFAILRACRRYGIQALHVHDLPYAFAAVLAGRRLKIPVVFDMHEHYVEVLEDSFNTSVYRKYKPFSAPLLWLMTQEEKYACRHSTKIIVIGNEHIDRLIPLGARKEQFVEVANTDDPEFLASIPIQEEIVRQYQDSTKYTLLYIGGFNPFRGLDTAIKAMPIVLKKIPHARLLLVGDGESRRELEKLTKDLHLQDHIIFPGFVPFQHVPTYIRISDVCLLPLWVTAHIETGITNKFFQYMIFGKPMIVSNARPMVRVINETGCGLLFPDRNPQSLAEKIIELQDREKQKILGQNGYRAAREKYNWQTTVRSLLSLYDELTELKKKG